ncbi:MAG TPA: branched-chain amino acid ABC transporter permease [Acidimicrobiia bacterium]|jgi:branched-chain amino acid transport system permease protein|nr:branched-chain amino acid ABC transporter permease [Acidimicrobiia bacterium]HIL06350.1 branched-chain amino acid ABC transporter permease [Acidimicrobiia bacterium]
MDLVLLLQRIFDALFNSAIYSSLALALVIIFRSTGLLNFAQGEMATFTAYIAFVFLSGPQPRLTGGGLAGLVPGVPFPIPLAIIGAVICGMAGGAVTERALIRPLGRAPDLALVNITIGILLATNSLMAQWWGTGPRMFPAVFPSGAGQNFIILGARLRYSTIGVWAVLLTVLVLLVLLLRHTRTGLAFRAVSISPSSAELVGVRVGPTLMYGWALASGFGALAACLSANSVLLEPNMMLRVLVYAFAAATLGGLDSPKGALIGGLIIGLSQTLIPAYVPFIGFELSVLPALIAMVAILLVRPAGLYGTKRIERV